MLGNVRGPVKFVLSPLQAGSKVVEVIMATRTRDDVADLVGETGWARCATDERGWDATNYADTASNNDTANGGSGNSAKIDGTVGGNTATVMQRRVRLTRTTKLDSLRGWERVLLRCRVSAASVWEILLKYGPSLADPAPEISTLGTVTLDASAATSHGYVEVDLGDIKIPEDGDLAGVAVEVWARRVSGTGDLFMNFTRHLPNTPGKDELTRVMAPTGGEEIWTGGQLVTPVTNPAGGTAGTVSNDIMLLDNSTDNTGAPPNTGLAWPVGHHRVTFDVTHSSGTLRTLIRNITDSTDAVSQTHTAQPRHVAVLEFDSVAGKFYQPQVDDPSFIGTVYSIKHEVIPAAGQNEQITTDPERTAAEKRNSAGNLLVKLATEGEVPFVIRPGPMVAVFVVPLDAPRTGYAEPESVKARTVSLVATGAPRYIG